jgi:hypothetical protein
MHLPRRTWNLSLLVGGALFGVACAAGSSGATFTSGSGGSGGSGGSSSSVSTTASGTLSGSPDTVDVGATGSMSDGVGGGSCAASTQKAQQIPLDMYVMLDKSGSMTTKVGTSDRWTAVTNALGSFLKQPDTDGISVGIQYFAQPTPGAAMCGNFCSTDADCGDPTCGPCVFFVCSGSLTVGGDSCNGADYAKPAVEISALPAAADTIIKSMKAQTPDGGTPTSGALSGAVQHAKAWAMKNPSHVTIAVFATDGDPSECDTSITGISKIASDAFAGTPKIPTYVIGVGKLVSNLNTIAAAGGTGKAFLVEDAMANTKFLEAMNEIRGSALACSYLIPTPTMGTPDFDAVNVQYTAGGGAQKTIFPKVDDKSKCVAGTDAWYYDNNTDPKQIILCEDTCTKLSKDMKGEVDILLGCKTVVK